MAENQMPSLDDILGDGVDVNAAPAVVATSIPVKKRSGKSSEAEIAKTVSAAIDSVLAKQSEADAKDPYFFILNQMEQPAEVDMSSWAIDILCNATVAIRYRQIFRAAAEQCGEMGVYRLLRTMVVNTHHLKHNQLWIAACPSIASARIAGKGVKMPDGLPLVSADIMCRRVLEQAKVEHAEVERVRKYGTVRFA